MKKKNTKNDNKTNIIIGVVVLFVIILLPIIYFLRDTDVESDNNPYNKTYNYTIKDSKTGMVVITYLELTEDYCALTLTGVTDTWLSCSVSQNSSGEYTMNIEGFDGEYKYVDGNFVCDECTTMEIFEYSGNLEK